jgi:hypothetical protein
MSAGHNQGRDEMFLFMTPPQLTAERYGIKKTKDPRRAWCVPALTKLFSFLRLAYISLSLLMSSSATLYPCTQVVTTTVQSIPLS